MQISTEAFIEQYHSLFAGRPDVYAVYREWYEINEEGKRVDKKAYIPSVDEVVQRYVDDTKYNEDTVYNHLSGKQFIGIYPLHEDNTVKVCALDFDGKHGDPWKEAVRQHRIFQEEAGVPSYIERSRSGNGYHLWIFFEEYVPAAKVRHGLKPFIHGAATFDRMIPMQDTVSERRPYGNLIALPLFGKYVKEHKGVFVLVDEDGNPVEIPDQKSFLFEIARVSTEKVYELFENAPEPYEPEREGIREEPLEGLSGAHKVIHPIYGCEWIRWCKEHAEEVDEPTWYALACQFAQLENGRELFHEWSKADRKRYDAKDTDDKFDHALAQNKPPRCDTIRETCTGPKCRCDERFPGIVKHPYDLAKVPFHSLIADAETTTPRIIVQSANEGLLEAFEWAKKVHKNPEEEAGIRYGIDVIDEHTRLRGSDLVILGGRPGSGKTALGMDIMWRVASMYGIPAYVFSLEMARAQLWKRLIARGSGVSHGRMSTGMMSPEDWKKLIRFKRELAHKNYPIFVDDVSRSTYAVMEVAADLVHRHGPGVILFDYLQLAAGFRNESTVDKVSRVTNDLKELAKALDVPIIALTQLNRAADDMTTDSEPSYSWLKDSGVIEQTSDVIMYLLGKQGPGIKERTLYIGKERHRGGGIRLTLEFNQPLMTFGAVGTWGKIPRDTETQAGSLIVPPAMTFDNALAWGV